MDWNALRAEFPRNAVSWRAQSVSKKDPEKPKALALAYIDARDVMERLDAVCGPSNWQDAYVETAKGRLLCTLSIRTGGEWIAKSDGAGNTDVEGDKGAISDALKRAAVKWGIGRYLYEMPTPWVPCKLYNDKWSDWADDPWKYVRNVAPQPVIHTPINDPLQAEECFEDTNAAEMIESIKACMDETALMTLWTAAWKSNRKRLCQRADVIKAKDDAKARLMSPDPFGTAA